MVQMSSLYRRPDAVADTTAHLNAQLSELNRFRDHVRKAQRSARKSRWMSRRRRGASRRGCQLRRPDASLLGIKVHRV